jgi:hypothetical protein
MHPAPELGVCSTSSHASRSSRFQASYPVRISSEFFNIAVLSIPDEGEAALCAASCRANALRDKGQREAS